MLACLYETCSLTKGWFRTKLPMRGKGEEGILHLRHVKLSWDYRPMTSLRQRILLFIRCGSNSGPTNLDLAAKRQILFIELLLLLLILPLLNHLSRGWSVTTRALHLLQSLHGRSPIGLNHLLLLPIPNDFNPQFTVLVGTVGPGLVQHLKVTRVMRGLIS
jgi:hypothetical protein